MSKSAHLLKLWLLLPVVLAFQSGWQISSHHWSWCTCLQCKWQNMKWINLTNTQPTLSTVFWNWGTFGSSDNVNALSCTDPGLDICAAVGTWDHNIYRTKTLNHEETNWEQEARSCKLYKWIVCTSGGDNALHINAGLLQVIDGESCAWTGDTHGYLSGHHGNGCGLNWPHACNWFFF